MSRRWSLPLLPLILLAACTQPARAEGEDAAAGPDRLDFNRDIRPILSETCYQCHGPDANKRKADLRLDRREGIFQEIEGGGAIVVPGSPDESELIFRVEAEDETVRMPPPKWPKQLMPEQVATLRRWVEEGAEWKGHWAYIPPERPEVPEVGSTPFVRNEIDKFLVAALKRQGMEPSPEADRITLIRRLSFDLTGLPPTPEEIDAFLADPAPDAYERLVDRLLGSPAYGERMAAYWLDLVRYADTIGYHGDNHQDVWMYRDWVIDAFNRNMPFDRFTTEQLAGDLLPEPTREQRVASGYNRLLMTTREGGAQAKEYMAKYAADRVRNVSTVWMAATVGCAECHDHKYDPYTSKDFYSLAAYFADLKETAVGEQQPTYFPNQNQKAELQRIDTLLAPARAQRDRAPQDEAAKAAVALLEGQRAALLAETPSMVVSESIQPRTMRLLPRGNWLDDSGAVVTPATPAFLPGSEPEPSEARRTRLDLARWVTDPGNPLTARVMVNRLWKLTFGRGIVATPDDFGSQGAWPTHPRLLDWLAVESRDSGWDVKHVLRLIVTSGAYRQTSRAPAEIRRRDPDNRWFARQGRYRLDAEMVRDNVLAASGLLVFDLGGPSARPYQPAGYWAHLNFPTREYQPDTGMGLYRRGVYTYWCRTFLHPSLLAFDAPTREECTVDRPRSNTPLQALVLLNDPTYVEAARALAERVTREAGAGLEPRIHAAYRRALSRPARPEEVNLLSGLYREHLAEYQADPAAAQALLHTGAAPVATDLDAADLAALTSVTRAILNLHETITRN